MIPPSVSRYTEVATPIALRERVQCTWQFHQGNLDTHPTQVLPDGCVDFIWNGSSLFVAGPDSRAAIATLAPGSTLTGVRLAHGTAAGLLGLPLHHIADQRVLLSDIWGSRHSGDWELQLHEAMDPAEVLHALCLSRELTADRQMQWIFSMLQSPSAPRVSALAAALNMTERSLRRRCQQAVGYGPKTLDRILRLQRFLKLAPQHATLTSAALEAGYGDAPHLVRDSQLLTGLTPRELVARHVR
ncbi:helix-turn-helix domain-containing protein [Dyella sp.]|uniref:helix-turn-helix domain-containing protein n=1 Tax=Dyella sp. TaxID=1869338 RepID=UPI0028406988|nr:helix-turn-helix domain-containing protein [Dyella sp.]MDR3446880.1 helix-turn-helix domain-containing protein [Dyella sp.]